MAAGYYPLSSPVAVQSSTAPAVLHFKNDSSVVEWDLTMNATDEMVIGNSTTPDVLHLYPSGKTSHRV